MEKEENWNDEAYENLVRIYEGKEDPLELYKANKRRRMAPFGVESIKAISIGGALGKIGGTNSNLETLDEAQGQINQKPKRRLEEFDVWELYAIEDDEKDDQKNEYSRKMVRTFQKSEREERQNDPSNKGGEPSSQAYRKGSSKHTSTEQKYRRTFGVWDNSEQKGMDELNMQKSQQKPKRKKKESSKMQELTKIYAGNKEYQVKIRKREKGIAALRKLNGLSDQNGFPSSLQNFFPLRTFQSESSQSTSKLAMNEMENCEGKLQKPKKERGNSMNLEIIDENKELWDEIGEADEREIDQFIEIEEQRKKVKVIEEEVWAKDKKTEENTKKKDKVTLVRPFKLSNGTRLRPKTALAKDPKQKEEVENNREVKKDKREGVRSARIRTAKNFRKDENEGTKSKGEISETQKEAFEEFNSKQITQGGLMEDEVDNNEECLERLKGSKADQEDLAIVYNEMSKKTRKSENSEHSKPQGGGFLKKPQAQRASSVGKKEKIAQRDSSPKKAPFSPKSKHGRVISSALPPRPMKKEKKGSSDAFNCDICLIEEPKEENETRFKPFEFSKGLCETPENQNETYEAETLAEKKSFGTTQVHFLKEINQTKEHSLGESFDGNCPECLAAAQKKNKPKPRNFSAENSKLRQTLYKPPVPPDPNQKTLIFNSANDQHILSFLLNQNYVLNPSKSSLNFHLKWTSNDCDEDYKFLNNHQYFNHFQKNREITTKSSLSKNLSKFSDEKPIFADEWYPPCYDLGLASEIDKFRSHFEFNLMLCLLKKLILYFKTRRLASYRMTKELIRKKQNEENPTKEKAKKKKDPNEKRLVDLIANDQDEKFLFNFYVMQSFLPFMKERIYTKYHIDGPEESSEPAEALSKEMLELVLKYARFSPFVDEIDEKKLIRIGGAMFLWKTPNEKCLKSIVKLHLLLKESTKKTGYSSFGHNNIWIVKPGLNARGSGIFLSSSIEEILTKGEQISARVVQKYIEFPLLASIPSKNIRNVKFDVRQWVLVKQFKPLEAFLFSHPYGRLCSKPYESTEWKDCLSHLSNYSINKKEFSKQKKNGEEVEKSLLSLEEMKEILKRHKKTGKNGASWDEEILPQINRIILSTLRVGAKSIVQRKNCFELYGYDILIDSNVKAWLLEINLSPACQERGDFLGEMLPAMARGLFSIVLPEKYLSSKKKRPDDPNAQEHHDSGLYSWVPLKDEWGNPLKTEAINKDPPNLALKSTPLDKTSPQLL